MYFLLGVKLTNYGSSIVEKYINIFLLQFFFSFFFFLSSLGSMKDSFLFLLHFFLTWV